MKYAGYIGFCLVISLSLLYTTTASTSTKHRSSNRISSSSKHTKCTHTRASSHNSGEENPFDCQEPDTSNIFRIISFIYNVIIIALLVCATSHEDGVARAPR